MSDLSFESLELAIAALEQGLREHEQYPQLLSLQSLAMARVDFALCSLMTAFDSMSAEAHDSRWSMHRSAANISPPLGLKSPNRNCASL